MTPIKKNLQAKTLESAIFIIGSLLQYIILARYVTEQEFGEFMFVLALIFLVRGMSFLFGIESVSTRSLCQDGERNQTLSTAFLLQAIIAATLLVPLISLFLVLDYFQTLQWELVSLSVVFLLSTIPLTLNSLLSAEEKIATISFINSIATTLSVMALALCWYFSLPSSLIYGCVAITPVVQSILTLVVVPWRKHLQFSFFSKTLASSIFVEAIPLVAMFLVTSLYVRIDVIMLDWWYGKETVGYYSAAYNFLDYLMVISNSLLAAYFPNFAKLAVGCSKEFKLLYRSSILLLVRYLFPVAAGIAFLAPVLIESVYGESFLSGVSSLRLLMIAAIIAWLNGASGTIFVSHKRQGIYLIGVVVSCLVNIIANLILIPPYGMEGAAVATIFTELTLVSFCYYEIYKLIGYVPGLKINEQAVPLPKD